MMKRKKKKKEMMVRMFFRFGLIACNFIEETMHDFFIFNAVKELNLSIIYENKRFHFFEMTQMNGMGLMSFIL